MIDNRTSSSNTIAYTDRVDSSREEIVPEPEWEPLWRELVRSRGTVLIIGKTDAGKSTLIRYLIKSMLSGCIPVTLVDSDIGQSSLGPPGTICMKLFRDEKDFNAFQFESMSFLGTTNPAMVIPMMIETCKKMADIGRKTSEITLIDTTGLISGNPGKALKTGKIKTIDPEHIIAVWQKEELDHILTSAVALNIHWIRAARAVKARSRTTRIRYRQKRLDAYFNRQLFGFMLNKDRVKTFYHAHPIRLEEHKFPQGTVIGLNHYEDTVGLGIVVTCIGGSISFKSPIKSIKGINTVVMGDMRIR